MGGPESPARVAVIGLGNVLLGDDGFGPFVIEILSAGWEFPAEMALIDAGTPGLDLVSYLQGRDVVILVDAVAVAGPPGELCVYEDEAVRTIARHPRVSPHDPAVPDALAVAELAGDGPRRVRLVGVIPESLDLGAGLSDPVRAAAASAAALVLEELAACGVTAIPRPGPRDPDAWWIRAGTAGRPGAGIPSHARAAEWSGWVRRGQPFS